MNSWIKNSIDFNLSVQDKIKRDDITFTSNPSINKSVKERSNEIFTDRVKHSRIRITRFLRRIEHQSSGVRGLSNVHGGWKERMVGKVVGGRTLLKKRGEDGSIVGAFVASHPSSFSKVVACVRGPSSLSRNG